MNNKYLDKLKKIAENNQATLISNEWLGAYKKYSFLLDDGRVYTVDFYHLISNGWPKNIDMAINLKLQYQKIPEDKLNELKLLAEQNGGKLLSTQWINKNSKYKFEFSNGVQFERSGFQMLANGWPKDSSDKYIKNYQKTSEDRFIDLKLLAEYNGAKLLSTQWLGHRKLHLFEKDGVQFEARPVNIKSNGFPKDPNNFIKKNKIALKSDDEKLNDLAKMAEKYDGKLLSTEWLGADKLYEFYDNKTQQTFYKLYSSVRSGYWTNDRGLLIEPICRQIFEHLFENKFKKTQSILTAKLLGRSRPLELDGYCKKLNIAFEYQGDPAHWDKNDNRFKDVHEKDLIKKEYCKKLGIVLIEIGEYSKSNINDDELFNHVMSFIIKTYNEQNLPLPAFNEKLFKIDFTKISHALEQLEKLDEIAKSNNGKLLSTEWRGWNNKYLFKNDKEEEFLISPHNLKNRGWPKDITKYNNGVIFRKKTDNDLFEELQLLAEQNGGKLIDTEWKGSHFDYSFKHSNGKIFQINSPNLKRRGWPHNLDEFLKFSNGHKKSVEDRFNVIKKLAEDNNGKILETEWLGNHHKYTCFFENGQQFIMEGVNLKRNGWPKNPESYFKRLNSSIIGKQNQKDLNQERLNTIKKIAEDNNGKILETEWLGNHHKYTCFFENGQQFIMEGVNLKRNGWPKNQTQYMNYINSIK